MKLTLNQMKKTILLAVLILVVTAGLIHFPQATVTVSAAESLLSMEKQRVFDRAGLLTEDQIATLERHFLDCGINANADIYLFTTNSLDGKSSKKYLEDAQDEEYFTKKTMDENCALMLVEMEDRTVVIQGYGDCEFWLNNDRIEYMLDDVYEYLSDGNFFGAGECFATEVDYYMNQDKGVSREYLPGQDYGESATGYSDYYGHEPGYYVEDKSVSDIIINLLFKLIISAVISLIVVLILKSNTGTKVTVTNRTYFDAINSGLEAKVDDYLRTVVTRRRKPQQTTHHSSGGGSSFRGGRSSGGGGRSSGGRSHSGGSRRF